MELHLCGLHSRSTLNTPSPATHPLKNHKLIMTSTLSVSLPLPFNSSYQVSRRFGLGHPVIRTRRWPSTPLVRMSSASQVPLSPPSSSPPSSIPSSSVDGNHKPNLSRTFGQSAESTIERVIFDFRFLALLAIAGSLAGSLLCFLNGCVYIADAYKVHWNSCLKGIHTGQMVLRLVEAIDVYLAGTVMLIFAMGLYGLFISNASPDVHPTVDRALHGSSLFGMFALKERPRWMKISSLDELKTKVGHVIVMILLVKMFERSKMVAIATGLDLLNYSVCIFLSSASLYILHNLHRGESEE